MSLPNPSAEPTPFLAEAVRLHLAAADRGAICNADGDCVLVFDNRSGSAPVHRAAAEKVRAVLAADGFRLYPVARAADGGSWAFVALPPARVDADQAVGMCEVAVWEGWGAARDFDQDSDPDAVERRRIARAATRGVVVEDVVRC